jgi:hypothetical protein
MSDFFGAMGTAIYGKLSAGTALTTALGGTLIYADQAPDGASRPYVIFNHQGGGPEFLSPHEMRNNVWFVRAYADTRAQAGLLDGHAEDLLHKQPLTVSGGWTNFWIVRESDVSLVENLPNGKKIYFSGGMYRVRLSK